MLGSYEMSDLDGFETKGHPLCIRFKKGTSEKVREIASQNGLRVSTWIKRLVFNRVERVLDHKDVSILEYTTAEGYGDQICIRLSKEEMLEIRRAAIIEKSMPSPWIRAIVMENI